MKASEYLPILTQRLSGYFDFSYDQVIGNVAIDMVANSHRKNERYLLTKKNTIYRYDNFEYFFFVDYTNRADSETIALANALSQAALQMVNPDESHMSTDFTIIVYVDAISASIYDFVNRFKCRKLLSWGLRGRIHIGLVVIDCEQSIVYSKDRRRKDYRFLDPNKRR